MHKIVFIFLLIFSSIIGHSQCSDSVLDFGRNKAEKLAYSTMKKISPNTGKNPNFRITNCNYDRLNAEFIFRISISWDAKEYSNPFYSYEEAKVWAEFTIQKENSKVAFKILELNSHTQLCLDSHWIDRMSELAYAIAEYSNN